MYGEQKAALVRLHDWGMGPVTRDALAELATKHGRMSCVANKYMVLVSATPSNDENAMLATLAAMPRSLVAALMRVTKTDDLTR